MSINTKSFFIFLHTEGERASIDFPKIHNTFEGDRAGKKYSLYSLNWENSIAFNACNVVYF